MERAFEAFLEKQAGSLVAGEVASLLKVFKVPLPIFHPGGMQLLASEAEIRAALEALMASYRRIGVRDVSGSLEEYATKPASDTVGCLMLFKYLGADRTELRRTRARYFLEPVGGSYRIVMLEYDQAAFPEIFPEFCNVIPLPTAKD